MSRASFPIGSLCDYNSGTLGHVTCVQVAAHTPEGVRVLFPWIAHPGKVITDLSRLTVRDLPHVCNNERSRSPIRAGTATATEQPNLHVSGLPGSMSEQDVREYLGSAGTTRSMQVPYHSRNTLRGYAFVIYDTQEGTDRALSWDGTWWVTPIDCEAAGSVIRDSCPSRKIPHQEWSCELLIVRVVVEIHGSTLIGGGHAAEMLRSGLGLC